MATGVISWSQTPASNASADSAIDWREGQAPSSVNNSARAEMASVAKWRDDISGALTTGGTSTAYTITSNQTYTLTAGFMIAFVPHTTNGATVTLNVDGLGAKPLRSAPGATAELASGVLVQGTPYVATYFTSNSGEWILHSFYANPYSIPIGGMMPYVSSTAPNSAFVLPYGQAVNRTTYSTLFAMVSTTFGVGDGLNTFNLPDIRGRSIFGLDNMGGSAASRITNAGSGIVGTTIGASGGAQTVTLVQGNLPNVNFTIPSGQGSHTHTITNNPMNGDNTGGSFTLGGPGATNINNTAVHILDATLPAMTAQSGGSDTPVNKVPPAIILPYILRIV